MIKPLVLEPGEMIYNFLDNVKSFTLNIKIPFAIIDFNRCRYVGINKGNRGNSFAEVNSFS